MYTPSRCGCTLLAVLPTEIAERVNGPFADLLYSYQHMYAHALSLSVRHKRTQDVFTVDTIPFFTGGGGSLTDAS